MCDVMCNDYRAVICQIRGGTAKTDERQRRMAASIRRRCAVTPYERIVAVVSARRIEPQSAALRIVRIPNSRVMDLFHAARELRAVALLVLQLERLGLLATGLNIHETGLTLSHLQADRHSLAINPRHLLMTLAAHSVVVVPGSFATDSDGAIVSLAAMEQDWGIALLAESLQAIRCEVFSDVVTGSTGRLQTVSISTADKPERSSDMGSGPEGGIADDRAANKIARVPA